MILIIAGLLATSLLVTPTMFHSTEYGASSARLLTGLAVAAINCAIAAGLVRFRQPSRWASHLAAFGLLLNGYFPTITEVSPFDFGRPGSRFFATVGLTALLYAALCLAAFVVLRYERPSPSPAKDQGADAGERLAGMIEGRGAASAPVSHRGEATSVSHAIEVGLRQGDPRCRLSKVN